MMATRTCLTTVGLAFLFLLSLSGCRRVHWLGGAPADAGAPTDAGGPIKASDLAEAWGAEKVPCVDENGALSGEDIPIVDQFIAVFFAVSRSDLPADTASWVGDRPAALILWDPNACVDYEKEPKDGPEGWEDAGLLIRGATLDAQGRLVLAPGTNTGDIDLVDISEQGHWEGNTAGAGDVELPTLFKQLVNPVARAKEVVVELGGGTP